MTANEYAEVEKFAQRLNMTPDQVTDALAAIGCNWTNYRTYTAYQCREACRTYAIKHKTLYQSVS